MQDIQPVMSPVPFEVHLHMSSNLVDPEPQLSGLAGRQKVHYYTCAEGVTNDLLWVWLHIE